ncbi:hypothetical protein [Candidatus Vidania fulgoroideorum]
MILDKILRIIKKNKRVTIFFNKDNLAEKNISYFLKDYLKSKLEINHVTKISGFFNKSKKMKLFFTDNLKNNFPGIVFLFVKKNKKIKKKGIHIKNYFSILKENICKFYNIDDFNLNRDFYKQIIQKNIVKNKLEYLKYLIKNKKKNEYSVYLEYKNYLNKIFYKNPYENVKKTILNFFKKEVFIVRNKFCCKFPYINYVDFLIETQIKIIKYDNS